MYNVPCDSRPHFSKLDTIYSRPPPMISASRGGSTTFQLIRRGHLKKVLEESPLTTGFVLDWTCTRPSRQIYFEVDQGKRRGNERASEARNWNVQLKCMHSKQTNLRAQNSSQ